MVLKDIVTQIIVGICLIPFTVLACRLLLRLSIADLIFVCLLTGVIAEVMFIPYIVDVTIKLTIFQGILMGLAVVVTFFWFWIL